MASTIQLRIRRRDDPKSESYWEEFEIPYRPSMNVISCLMEIQKRPVTAKGEKTTPVVWDAACLEEVCGSCSMVINGRVRQACSTLIDQLHQPITIEPMSKFPCIRDLRVDRQVMFDNLKKVKAWIPIDGTHSMGGAHSVGGAPRLADGLRIEESNRLKIHDLAQCTACGACLEVCPQYHEKSPFIGASAISQVRRFNGHPAGVLQKGVRLMALMEEGGLDDCGNAQNCVKACPVNIPLTESIAEMGREVTKYALGKLFGR